MLRKLYIINTKAEDPIFQKAYLANILINFREMPQTFYKMNLLLEYQNKKFKQF